MPGAIAVGLPSEITPGEPSLLNSTGTPFAPSALNGLQLWLAADATSHLWQDSARTTPAVLDGDPVGAWDDLSGAGNNALQVTSTKRPLLKLAVQNGRSVVRFDGVDDWLTAPHVNFGSGAGGAYTVVAVVQPAIASGTGVVIAEDDNALGRPFLVGVKIATGIKQTAESGASNQGVGTTPLTGTYVLSWDLGNTTFHFFNNGIQENTGAGATVMPSSTAPLGVGGRSYSGATATFMNDIAEVVVFNRVLATAERQAVEGYLGTKWAVPVATPKAITGLALWLDSVLSPKWQDSARTVPAVADGDPVGAWDDLSGTANHATQPTNSQRPTLYTSTVGKITNGQPALYVNGLTQCLLLPAGNTALNITGALTLYAVVWPDNPINDSIIQSGNSATSLTGYLWGIGNAGRGNYNPAVLTGDATWRGSTGAYVQDDSPHVHALTLAGTTSTFYLDGVAGGAVAGAAPASHTGPRAIMSNNTGSGGYSGRFMALLVYAGAHTAAQIAAVTAYLASRYMPQSQWTRRGTVLQQTVPADQTNVFEPSVIYEGGAQILSGNVFKMWYTGGWTNSNICYAESLDGMTWTKYASNPVIANHARSSVFRDLGGTYYCYTVATPAQTQMDLYTSPDGVTWTLDTASVVAVGAGGAWDATLMANSTVWKEAPTDWRMLYEAYASPGSWKIGYATSPDGRVWTKSASNPVLQDTGGVGGPFLYKKGTANYWLWLHRSVTLNNALPTDLDRYSSPDLINWTRSPAATTLNRRTADEGVGTQVGQAADVCLVEVAGTTYLFHAASSDGTAQAGALHIKLATVPLTMAQLVTTNEGVY